MSGSVPVSRYTVDDLDRLPDDGNRYEVVDGGLLVTPAPGTRHQRAVGRLFVLLNGACRPDQEVLPAPVNFVIGPLDVPQPDLIVASVASISERGVEGQALLVVEVLSPTTRITDTTVKVAKYAEAGVAWYWIVDPDEPSLTVLRLTSGGYEEEAVVRGEEPYRAELPMLVTVAPASLV